MPRDARRSGGARTRARGRAVCLARARPDRRRARRVPRARRAPRVRRGRRAHLDPARVLPSQIDSVTLGSFRPLYVNVCMTIFTLILNN